MAIPKHNQIYKEVLEILKDERDYNYREVEEILANKLDLPDNERGKLLDSGVRTILIDRVGWSITYMSKAGLVQRTKRGYFKITSEGLRILKENKIINDETLMQYQSFVEFKTVKSKNNNKDKEEEIDDNSSTPNEVLERGHRSIVMKLQSEILEQIQSCTPMFFERLVVDLLISMGYGGSRKDAGEAVGRSGDEGIDGVIKEDKLGLDKIYIQAKRWQGTVGRPEIQKFVGALHGKHAKKGIFITTSTYTSDAVNYASGVESNIILIDGDMLSKLMIEHDVGVSTESVYEIKRIDSDYFIE